MGIPHISTIQRVIKKIEQEQKPHWTREPPTEPGWYWVGVRAVEHDGYDTVRRERGIPVYLDSDGNTHCDEDIIRWYSEPIKLPPLPKGDEG